MYLKRDVIDSRMFTIMPKKKIRAASEPYFTSTGPTMASLFGTTPCTLNACWNMLPKGSSAPETTDAPAASTRNPTSVRMVPFMMSVAFLRCTARPISEIRATMMDG